MAPSRSRPRTTRSTPWRRSSTTTENPYVQWPSRSRTGRSPPPPATSSEHGPIRRSIHRSEPPPRATRSTRPGQATRAAPARTARPVPLAAVVARPRLERRPRAVAAVDEALRTESLERGGIRSVVVGLPHRALVGREPEPRQVLQQVRLERRSRPDPIVVLDPKEDAAPLGTSQAPDEDRVRHVSEMEMAGRRRCEPRPRRSPVSRHDRGRTRVARRSSVRTGPPGPAPRAHGSRP